MPMAPGVPDSRLVSYAHLQMNPVPAGIAQASETSTHTSIKQRVEHVREQDRAEDLKVTEDGRVAGSKVSEGMAVGCWAGISRRWQKRHPLAEISDSGWPRFITVLVADCGWPRFSPPCHLLYALAYLEP